MGKAFGSSHNYDDRDYKRRKYSYQGSGRLNLDEDDWREGRARALESEKGDRRKYSEDQRRTSRSESKERNRRAGLFSQSHNSELERNGKSTPLHPARRSRFDQKAPVNDLTHKKVEDKVLEKQDEADIEAKLRARQEKIAAWKRERKETSSPHQRGLQATTNDVSQTGATALMAKKPLHTRHTFVSAVTENQPSNHNLSGFEITGKRSAKSKMISAFVDEDTKTRMLHRLSPPPVHQIAQDVIPPKEERATSESESDDAGIEVDETDEGDPLESFMNTVNAQLDEAVTGPGGLLDAKIFGQEDEDVKSDGDGDEDLLVAAKKLSKKKELQVVNHSKIEYEPFRKDFFVEPVEMAEKSEQEIDELRLEFDGIKVRGVKCPRPFTRWSHCGLPSPVMDVVRKLKFERPFSIQAQSIPAIMSGRDVIGVAKTGSGKTLAFLLPMFRHIKDQRPLEGLDGPIAIIMTPTRELATQIHKECRPYLKALDLKAVCAYGGPPINAQIADLKRGAEIVVCTPGRMIDLLTSNGGRVLSLRRVTYLVLDEADRMFDMGFEPQVMKIIGNIRPDRQTVLFSATFPKQMEALARKILRKPLEIIVGARSVVAPEVEQLVQVIENEEGKFLRLLELLGNLYNNDEDARTLVFVERQEFADVLLRDLMLRGYPCMSLHGGKDQVDRDSTIQDFKNGVVPIVIATSVAARGLDVKQLKLVVNYDCPNHMEDYVHRVGRTGRAGNKGVAVTFINPNQDRNAVEISKALRLSQQPVPDDVQRLVAVCKERIKEGKERPLGQGFGGKGLDRLDEDRAALRRVQKKLYGEDVDDEHQNASDDDERGDEPGDGKKTEDGEKSGVVAMVKAASSVIQPRKAGSGPDAGAFHATLEINDFPQRARWAVTNRTNIAKVLEVSGTSITSKGTFYPTGRTPGPNEDPKLYLLIEGDTEIALATALNELTRLVREGIATAAEDGRTNVATGRYSVL